jgi:hypothetical protein
MFSLERAMKAQRGSRGIAVQGGREVTVHPDNTHLRLNLSLHGTARTTM